MNKLLLITLISSLGISQLHTHEAYGQSKELVLTETGTKEYKFLFYRGYNTSMALELSASDLESMSVYSGAGNVTIKGHNGDMISVEASITLSATSPDKAINIIKEFMSLSLVKEGDEAILDSYFDFHQRSNFREAVNPNGFFSAPVRKIDLVVNVPKNLALKVNDRSGDLSIEGIENDLSVNDRSGYLKIKNVNGNLRVKDSSGDMSLLNINEKGGSDKTLRINDNSGYVKLDRVSGNVHLTDKSGDIDIRRVTGDVVLRDASGDLHIGEVDGDLQLSDASGDIRADNINGNFTVQDNSGGIYVNYVAMNVHVRDAGSGDLRIKSYDGKISGDLRRLYR